MSRSESFMTVIPVLDRAVSLAGNVDPWHFQSTDSNKGAIASVLYKIITALEMLKPSTKDYDFRFSHAWTCPNLQLQCPCQAIVRNDEEAKRVHVESHCVHCNTQGLRLSRGVLEVYGPGVMLVPGQMCSLQRCPPGSTSDFAVAQCFRGG